MPKSYDAIIIGTGQAGPSLAARCAREGMKTAVVERKLFGGTCVNTGCIPTKTLVASAHAAHLARRANDFGVHIDGAVSVDMQKVKSRKDAMVRQSNEGVENWMKHTDNLTVYEGHARFTDPHTIEVHGDPLRGEKIFINVGARAFVPPGYEKVDYFTNTTIMDVDFLPEHLVIVGGSYIGLEFGQMYRRFGSKVTIVEKGPRVIAREDEDISAAIREFMEAEGVEFLFNAECLNGENRNGGIAVHIDGEDGKRKVSGSHLLLAVGRVPNTDDLGLENAGVAVDTRGYIEVDDQLRTSVPHIRAMGDCNGKGAFTHTSYNDFEIVAANLFDDDPRRVSDRIVCYALYTDPPLGRVGITEAQARASGRHVLIGTRPMQKITRARAKGETNGFMKILVDADTKEILGAAILGVGGDEIIHSILDIMYAKAPYTVIQRAVHIHPTVSELIPTMLGELESI